VLRLRLAAPSTVVTSATTVAAPAS